MLGLEFSITEDDIEIPLFCPVLGVMLMGGSIGRGAWPTSASLDRIDNSKGYTPGNVRVISWRANFLKSDATLEELEAIVRYMRANLLRRDDAA